MSTRSRLLKLTAFFLFSFIFLSQSHLSATITVGVYWRGSEARYSYRELITPFFIDDEIKVRKMTAADVANGELMQVDVFMITEMGLQGEDTTPVDFGDLGKKKVREFVENGGVYIGVGMGAKLGIKDVEKGFRLVDVDRTPFGGDKRGILEVRLNPKFANAFPEMKKQRNVFAYLDGFSAYFNPGQESTSIFDFESIVIPGMQGSSVLTKSTLGQGTVFLTSWKIHKSPGLKWILPRLVRLGTDGKIVDYSRYVNLNFHTRELFFTETFKRQRDNLISKLKVAMAANTDSEISKVTAAMTALSEGKYNNFLPHIAGRLRNHNKNVRKKAAEIVKRWQYFAVARELWAAIKNEADLSVLKSIVDAYDAVNLNFRGTNKDLREVEKNIKVAIYDDHGIGALDNGIALRETLKIDPLIKSVIIDAADIADGFLDKVKVVIFPGGSGSGIASMLGADGLKNVRSFVNNGGAYLGYCAGAYLGTASYKWSLHLLDVASYDSAHWARGGAIAEAKIEEAALEVFPELKGKDSLFQKFWQGPLMVEGNFGLPGFEIMLTFISDIHHRAPQSQGASPGKAWLIRSEKGRDGRVVLCSGHPEQTPGSRYFTPRLVRWLAQMDIIPYERYMDPFKYDAELMFNDVWKRRNDSYISVLVNNRNSEEMEKALIKLASEIHRASWYMPGFLRSEYANLRKLAAELTVDLQIFWAKKDIEVAYTMEDDPSTKKALKDALEFFDRDE